MAAATTGTRPNGFTFHESVKPRYSDQARDLTKLARDNSNSDSIVRRHLQAPAQLFLAGISEMPHGLARSATKLLDAPVHLVRGKFSEAGRDVVDSVKALAYTVMFAVASLVIAVAALVFPRTAFKAVGQGVESEEAKNKAEVVRLNALLNVDVEGLQFEKECLAAENDSLEDDKAQLRTQVNDLQAQLTALQQSNTSASVEDEVEFMSNTPEEVPETPEPPAYQVEEAEEAEEAEEPEDTGAVETEGAHEVEVEDTLAELAEQQLQQEQAEEPARRRSRRQQGLKPEHT